VPAKQTGKVDVLAVFDSGPLAGVLRAKRSVTVTPAS
jgi:hypothetical protein